MATDMDHPGAVPREIDTMEAERAEVATSLEGARRRQDNSRVLSSITEDNALAMLTELA